MGVKKKDRTGEVRMMNCGMNATVIKYIDCYNIAIRFEDGTVVTNKPYEYFKKGSIKNPNCHIGETKTMNCGEKATIIVYRNSLDIDVRFEDGTIVSNKSYNVFKLGTIMNPNKYRRMRLGKIKVMKCGMKAMIIEYRNVNDIDVQFENGVIKTHTSCGQFKKGNIMPPNYHVGEIKLQHNGLHAEIVEYVRIRDMTIRLEDGLEIPHVAYDNFQTGYIGHPDLCHKKDSIFHGFKTKLIGRDNKATYYTCQCTRCGEAGTMTPQQMLAHKCK